MTELRWLVDPRSDAHRVLQYRERAPNTQYQHADGYAYPESEWRDVPEVIAATSTKENNQ